jgi:coenzyme Q-binding protein COQ10
MASAERTETFKVEANQIFDVIKDYESYPDFMDGVSSIEILERDGNTAKVKYNINMIKKFSYTLNLVEESPGRLSWSFESGDLFHSNNGEWILKDNGDGTTDVTYKLDVDFKVKVPGMISKKLIGSNLPSMMKSVYNRARGQ